MPRQLEQDVILFESWRGAYADSPRAISEELSSRDVPLRQVWVGSGANQGIPQDVVVVKLASFAHLNHLYRARYIVTNDLLNVYLRKNPQTTYLQTWHGTPLKRIAFDIENPAFPDSRRYLENLSAAVAKWDFLISPNRFSTDILRTAFRYEGKMLETGYPRNDLLCSPDAHTIRARVRASLGIGSDERAVLYAPTWRDSALSFSLKLDLNAVTDEIADVVVLLRAHHIEASSVSRHEQRRVINVSSYPDIRDLYLAADLLITDYSSAMFDFAVTGKPMLFFTYDLDRYRDERGFYFDFESEVPGPLLTSTEAVIDALRNLEEISGRYRDTYDRFQKKFCHLDDGRASERVIKAVIDAN